MELPSINSTTSISDNPDLRNHYEKLLFKNQSGNSLSDLPNAALLKNSSGNPTLYQRNNGNKKLDNFDFISGFKNLNTNQSLNDQTFQLSQNDSRIIPDMSHYNHYGQQRHLSFPENYQQNQLQQQHRHLSFPENHQQQRMMTNQHSAWNQDDTRRYSANNNNHNYMVNSNNNNNNSSSVLPNGYVSTDNIILHQQMNGVEQVRKHHSLSNGEINGISNRWNAQDSNNNNNNNTNNNNNNIQYPPEKYLMNQNVSMRTTKNNYTVNQSDKLKQQLPHFLSNNNNNTTNPNEVAIEDGLLLVNGKDIVSSNELHQLYASCGNNYFSSTIVYPLIDYIKDLISIPNENVSDNNKKNNVLQFLTFLQSCNSNFANQFDNSGKPYDPSQIQNLNGNRGAENITSLQPKGLVLVSLKNGKLELLSTPHNTNLHLKRGDLVIIDGDRGKDLVQVVEANVSLNLALFTNFLKKKVHFDSLITAKYQHYPNDKFIQTLINSKNGSGERLNTKLYDIIELTQLIIPSKQVLRFATPWEVMTNLQHKFQDELKALHIAQMKLQNLNNSRINGAENGEVSIDKKPLNIKILNSEFQFDRKKLTFYYICEERNDFRELIKELFKFYKTRIWLCAIPNNLSIDSKYYDIERKELSIYEQMIRSQQFLESNGANSFSLFNPTSSTDEALNIPPLNKIELDNFQIGIYKELLEELF